MKLSELFESLLDTAPDHVWDQARTPKAAAGTAEDYPDRYRDIEDLVLQDASAAGWYALTKLGRRWPEAEAVISSDQSASIDYAGAVIKGRFLKAEPRIFKNPKYFEKYIKTIALHRIPELEDKIFAHSITLYTDYINSIKTETNVAHRLPKYEKLILEEDDGSDAVRYCNMIVQKQWPELEKMLLEKPVDKYTATLMFSYVRGSKKARWIAMERLLDPVMHKFGYHTADKYELYKADYVRNKPDDWDYAVNS